MAEKSVRIDFFSRKYKILPLLTPKYDTRFTDRYILNRVIITGAQISLVQVKVLYAKTDDSLTVLSHS